MLLLRSRKHKKKLMICGIMISLFIMHQIFSSSWPMKSNIIEENYSFRHKSQSSTDQTIKILYYNPPPWFRGFNFGNCEYSHCMMSTNRTNINDIDGVIFNHDHLPSEPPNKNPKQKWIFSCSESAYYGVKTCATAQWRYKFDWVMSYRHDSDFYFGYGDIIVRKGVIQKDYEEIYDQKKNLIAWITSHCGTHSKRERYVEKMSQIATVDVFGRCGTFKCERYTGYENDSCHDLVARDYKFYLAFENSLCRDYTTEKFYFLYEYDKPIIPVIMGSFTIENYSRGAVYFDVNNYHSPQHLARDLVALGNNKDAYIHLLRKKDKFSALTSQDTFATSMCKLCEYLTLEKPGRPDLDIADWFFGEKHCLSPDQIGIPKKKENINIEEARKYLNKA